MEWNKHILMAEKYGWDTVACYTADLLASDSDDENKIRKAVTESKQLREENKRRVSSKVTRPKGVIPPSSDRRVILNCNSVSAVLPFLVGKQNLPRDGPQMPAMEEDQPHRRPQAISNSKTSDNSVSGTDDILYMGGFHAPCFM